MARYWVIPIGSYFIERLNVQATVFVKPRRAKAIVASLVSTGYRFLEPVALEQRWDGISSIGCVVSF
ncbi:MAG: hypothetical protein IIC28_07150 [Chloroflexi bacterium]|nr:hypothetical protein [Chloroflexota bacterium]